MFSPKVGNQLFPPMGFRAPWSPELLEEKLFQLSPEEIYKRNKQIQRNDILDQNLDWIHLNFGAEGTGKTSLGIQDILEIDPKFAAQGKDLPQVIFSLKQFKAMIGIWRSESFYEGRRGVGLLFDEGNLVANARKVLSKESIEFTNLLTQIRAEFGFYPVFNFQSYRFAETYLKNDRCKSASRCRLIFDRRTKRHIAGQADFYNAPMVRKIKKNVSNNQIEFPEKALFIKKFIPATPFDLWKAVNQKKYDNLLEREEEVKNKTTLEKQTARLERKIMGAKLDNDEEKVKEYSQELKKLLLRDD